ncbi:MAG: DUF4168 domain-containing protein [Halofilum sp. (in: g-proteobacteria)]
MFTALFAIAPAVHAASENASGNEASFEQEQIESFAAAQAEVQQIQQEFASQLQQADEEQASQLQQEAQQEMAAAVDEAGLEVQEFNSIAQASRNDEDLSERIQEASE